MTCCLPGSSVSEKYPECPGDEVDGAVDQTATTAGPESRDSAGDHTATTAEGLAEW